MIVTPSSEFGNHHASLPETISNSLSRVNATTTETDDREPGPAPGEVERVVPRSSVLGHRPDSLGNTHPDIGTAP
jgi:hypothetical protein